MDAARRGLIGVPLALRVNWVRAVPALAAFVGVTAVGIADGGQVPNAWRLTLLALLALTAAALLSRERIALRRREWIVVAALAGLVAWTAAAKYWSASPASALPQAERTLLYAVCVAAVLLGLERGSLPALLGGTLAGVTAVSAYALGDYVFSPPPLNPFEGRLLHEPFGYANAVGIYAALGILLSLGLALWTRSRLGRARALAPLVVLAPTLSLTSSRGAWIALPVGIIAMLYIGGRIRSRALLAALLAAGVAAGFVLGSGRSQSLSVFGQNRPHYWSVAWKDYKEHPILGAGPDTFGNYWINHRTVPEYVRDAHNLYLESLAELGPLGLSLVVAGLGLPLLSFGRRQDPLVAAAGGAYVAFVLHAGVDWDWEMPAVTLAGVLCGAAVLVGTRGQLSSGFSTGVRAGLLGTVLLLAAFVLYRLETSGGLSPLPLLLIT